ncbi:diguanylate cyclase [Nonomuraea rhodomycinica]|uniref:diguanylate cyclase n=1 Tax=Nonomuraea rhodomycinica TaxID=1712872 RepID=UPI0028A7D86F|nr:diguanylate cyclase [Nonomuraea rhodomycinica]
MVYLVGIVTLDLVAIVLLAVSTPLRWPDIMAFVALMACGAACIEATRRLGMPAGVSRDLLSAWWLPVALLLPSLYALLAPIVLQILLQWRVRATVLHRRVFSSAAIGLAGCAASMTFHRLVPDPAALTRGAIEPIGWAVAAAVVFALLNTSLIALAAHMADPEVPWRSVLWDKESALLDVVELCLGVSVAISAGLNLVLLILALPPVVLLQRSLLHAQLQAAARTDPKTGLLNAAAWQREADTEIVRARRTGETLALLIVDIDHFKRVNDRHGHLVGDQVLAGVAATLRSQLREYDVVGRFGGEEFVVLLPGADVHEGRQVAERLRNRISHMAVAADDDAMITVTISVGVAIMSLHGDDLIELLAAADLALYRAKELGRDRICLPVIQPTHLADPQTAAIPVPSFPEDPHPEGSTPEDPHLESPHPEGSRAEGAHSDGSRKEGARAERERSEGSRSEGPRAEGEHSESSRSAESCSEGPRLEGSGPEGARSEDSTSEEARFGRSASESPRPEESGPAESGPAESRSEGSRLGDSRVEEVRSEGSGSDGARLERPRLEDWGSEGARSKGSRPDESRLEGSRLQDSSPSPDRPPHPDLYSMPDPSSAPHSYVTRDCPSDPATDPGPDCALVTDAYPGADCSLITDAYPGSEPSLPLEASAGPDRSPATDAYPGSGCSPIAELHSTSERSLESVFGSSSDGGSPVPDPHPWADPSPEPEPRSAPDRPPIPGSSHIPKPPATPDHSLTEDSPLAGSSVFSIIQGSPPAPEPWTPTEPPQTDEPQPTPPQLSDHPPHTGATPDAGHPATPECSDLRDRPAPVDQPPTTQISFSSAEPPQAADPPEAIDQASVDGPLPLIERPHIDEQPQSDEAPRVVESPSAVVVRQAPDRGFAQHDADPHLASDPSLPDTASAPTSDRPTGSDKTGAGDEPVT